MVGKKQAVLVVLYANAVIDPFAVMIEAIDTPRIIDRREFELRYSNRF